MAKFRKGDKVVRTCVFNDHGLGFMQQGSTYTVKDVNYMGMIAVEYDPFNRHFDDDKFERVEEPAVEEPVFKNMKGMFTNMKFRVNSPEHSKQIQEHLFTLGYKWGSLGALGTTLINANQPTLYTYADGTIMYDSADHPALDKFNRSENQEYIIELVQSFRLVPVEKKETITIDGKEYYKEDVLKRLAELNSLN